MKMPHKKKAIKLVTKTDDHKDVPKKKGKTVNVKGGKTAKKKGRKVNGLGIAYLGE